MFEREVKLKRAINRKNNEATYNHSSIQYIRALPLSHPFEIKHGLLVLKLIAWIRFCRCENGKETRVLQHLFSMLFSFLLEDIASGEYSVEDTTHKRQGHYNFDAMVHPKKRKDHLIAPLEFKGQNVFGKDYTEVTHTFSSNSTGSAREYVRIEEDEVHENVMGQGIRYCFQMESLNRARDLFYGASKEENIPQGACLLFSPGRITLIEGKLPKYTAFNVLLLEKLDALRDETSIADSTTKRIKKLIKDPTKRRNNFGPMELLQGWIQDSPVVVDDIKNCAEEVVCVLNRWFQYSLDFRAKQASSSVEIKCFTGGPQSEVYMELSGVSINEFLERVSVGQ